MIRSRVEQQGKVTEDVRYFISSLENVHTFAEAARGNWGIENSLHWCLDMTFREDYSRIRKDHSAENMAVVRHIALNIFKIIPQKSAWPASVVGVPMMTHSLPRLWTPFVRKPWPHKKIP